jgi:hypothetical protein
MPVDSSLPSAPHSHFFSRQQVRNKPAGLPWAMRPSQNDASQNSSSSAESRPPPIHLATVATRHKCLPGRARNIAGRSSNPQHPTPQSLPGSPLVRHRSSLPLTERSPVASPASPPIRLTRAATPSTSALRRAASGSQPTPPAIRPPSLFLRLLTPSIPHSRLPNSRPHSALEPLA